MKRTFLWNDIEFYIEGKGRYFVHVKKLYDAGLQLRVNKEAHITIKAARDTAIARCEHHGVKVTKEAIWKAILN